MYDLGIGLEEFNLVSGVPRAFLIAYVGVRVGVGTISPRSLSTPSSLSLSMLGTDSTG